MTQIMTPNREFIMSFMICFLVGLLLMLNYGASSVPIPSVTSRPDPGASNSWRDVRVEQNMKIARIAQAVIATGNQGGANSKDSAAAKAFTEGSGNISKEAMGNSPASNSTTPVK